jgi:hypothetical protein
MNFVYNWTRKHFTYPLRAKKVLWTRYVKIFCDGGQPIWHWFPHFNWSYSAPFWGFKGFRMYLFGREVNFIFGEDKNGLYK